jgi:hypothetical protein
MKTLMSALGQHKSVIAAALLVAGAAGGWAMSTTLVTNADAVEAALDIKRGNDVRRLPFEEVKMSLVGSYQVTGTDPDGRPYAGAATLDVALAPSGALELDWDNGKTLGVGQVIGNVLAVACLNKGRTAILMMTINPDRSLSGNWSRRTDRGYKGTENWKRT